MRLKAVAAGRAANRAAVAVDRGERWNADKHRLLFADGRQGCRTAGPCDRSIACDTPRSRRALLAGVPVRLVASSFDTSVAMIEKTYSKHIADHGDEQMRRVALDIDAVADGNVVPLARR